MSASLVLALAGGTACLASPDDSPASQRAASPTSPSTVLSFRDVVDLLNQKKAMLSDDQIKSFKNAQSKLAEEVKAFMDKHAADLKGVDDAKAEALLNDLPDPAAVFEKAMTDLPEAQRDMLRQAMKNAKVDSKTDSRIDTKSDSKSSRDSHSSHSSQSSSQSNSQHSSHSSRDSKTSNDSKSDSRKDSKQDSKKDAKSDSGTKKNSSSSPGSAKDKTSAKQRLHQRLTAAMKELDTADQERLHNLLADH
ncbi:MAG: hypothetical protein JNK35_04595 [Phycisphaerae bacterium]|nr:hypothetical protein [Phycisphaerae bacterium]